MTRVYSTLLNLRIWLPAAIIAAAVLALSDLPQAGLGFLAWGLAACVLWGWYSFKQLRQAAAFVAVVAGFAVAVIFFGTLAESKFMLPAFAGFSAWLVLAEGLFQRRGLSDTAAGHVISEAVLLVLPLALFIWFTILLGMGLGFVLPFNQALAAAAALTFMLSWPFLGGGSRGVVAGLVAALLAAETLWVVSFWPVGALGGGAVAACVAAAATAIMRDRFAGRFSVARAAASVFLAVAAIGLIMAMSRWLLRP
ncbi:hypothetical protein HYW67_01395 [Candidatus Parcubacteria bacterium]|nr:hypothetical protein [Candidatus Parcubacteria bacterium]